MRHSRGPRAQVREIKSWRFSSSLVFATFADRLQHLHVNRIEQYFSSTTDTLWLSGSQRTGTTLAVTPIEGSQSKDIKNYSSYCRESGENLMTGEGKRQSRRCIMIPLFKCVSRLQLLSRYPSMKLSYVTKMTGYIVISVSK